MIILIRKTTAFGLEYSWKRVEKLSAANFLREKLYSTFPKDDNIFALFRSLLNQLLSFHSILMHALSTG